MRRASAEKVPPPPIAIKQLPLARLWARLPLETQHQVLVTLSRLVLQHLIPVPAEKGGAYEED
jgi:hypothetical protein